MPITAGQVKTTNGTKRELCLMAAQATNLAAPTLTTDGYAMYPDQTKADAAAEVGHCFAFIDAVQSTLLIKGRCTAGQTLVGTFTLWGYDAYLDAWFEIPVNGGTAITPVALAETSTDQINFQQRFENLGHYDRVALELASIGGTGATFDAVLVTGRSGTGA